MFEPKPPQLLPLPRFIGRMARILLLALSIVTVALLIGIFGYHSIAHLSWIDSILNASMILTGMGPVDPMKTHGAKLFASAYAIFSGVVFLTSVGVVISPLFHRLLHKFHLEETAGDKSPNRKGLGTGQQG